jgi:hypothetical protein
MGTPRDDQAGNNAGAAYVFRRVGTNWVQHQKLMAADAADFDSFGLAVAIDGDYMAVGAPADDDVAPAAGSVYVFHRSGGTWSQQAKFTPVEAAEDDEFGLSVAIAGDFLVAGARRDEAGSSSGAVYVYKRFGPLWLPINKIAAADVAGGDQFGLSIAMSGTRLIVGSRHDDDDGFNSGSAYIYRRTGDLYAQEQKIFASDGAVGYEFGVSVDIDGNYAIVGARFAALNEKNNAGAAYVFRRDGTTWSEEKRLVGLDTAQNDQFGNSVALDGAIAVVGAWHDADAGINTGAAYAFHRFGTDWTEVASKLTTPTAAAADEFGFAVAVSANYAMAGVPKDDGVGLTSGSAYAFGVGGDCNGNGVADPCDIENGTSNDFNGNGVPDECAIAGDKDADGDVDLKDIQAYQNCVTGLAGGILPACGGFDIELDDDVDSGDLDRMIVNLTGPQ